MPNKDAALLKVIEKEVDRTRDPRLGASQVEPIRSPDDVISNDGFFDNNFNQQALSNAKQVSSVKSRMPALSLSTDSDRHTTARKSIFTRVAHSGTNGVLSNTDDLGLIATRKEMKPLQLQNSAAVKMQARADVQTRLSKHVNKKGKEDLNEILRARLAKLEAQLSMIGSEHFVYSDTDECNENVTTETERGNARGNKDVSSCMGKRRKPYNWSDDGDDEFGKRVKTSDDETAQIIAANSGGIMADTLDAKLDKYISTVLKNEADPNEGEGYSSLSADISSKITSVIQSQFWEHSQNDDIGNVFPSSSAEQLLDTETIMLNVLSQNLTDTNSSYFHVPTQNTETNDKLNVGGTAPHMVDSDATTLTFPQVSKGNMSNLEHHKEVRHLGMLSVDTQWDSQFVESSLVKSTHLNSVRDWRSKKLLDLLISGRLKEIPVGTLSNIRHEGTDKLVASSLQNILSNLSWLWGVAVGDNMLDSVQDVVDCASSNLGSLLIDFVQHSDVVDIPVSMHLSNDRTFDDDIAAEVIAAQEIDKQDECWNEEYLLLEGLATSLDDVREKVLNQKHAVTLADNADSDIPEDLYSPTCPTELDLAAVIEDAVGSSVRRAKGQKMLQPEVGNEFLNFSPNLDLSDVLNENSPHSRRTIRISKKENFPASDHGLKASTQKGKHDNADSTVKGLPVTEDDVPNMSSEMYDAEFSTDRPVLGTKLESYLPGSDERMNQSMEMLNLLEAEIAKAGFAAEQTLTNKVHDGKSSTIRAAGVGEEFDSDVENRRDMSSLSTPIASHKFKSSKKHSNGRDGASGKSRRYRSRTDTKKDGHSRKRKERAADASGKKGKKKAHDVPKLLKSNVKPELDHVQKSIESLLCEKCGITIVNKTKISRGLSLHSDGKHFSILSGHSSDANPAITADDIKTDDILKMACSTPLLNDLLTELNIPVLAISLTMPENVLPSLTHGFVGEKLSVEEKPQTESPQSPPTLQKSAAKQSGGSISLRKRNSQEAPGVSIIPHQRKQDAAAVSETEKRLMKADKLMQTFRRSQIAKRQSQKAGSTNPPASSVKPVQTVPPSTVITPALSAPISEVTAKLTPSDTVDSQIGFMSSEAKEAPDVSSEVKEPDFSAVITDGSLLASVELPVLPPEPLPSQADAGTPVEPETLSSQFPIAAEAVDFSTVLLLPQTDAGTSSEPETLSSQPPVAAEAVDFSTVPVHSSKNAENNSANNKNGDVISATGREQRIYVFNRDRPVCQELEVCIECMFLIFVIDRFILMCFLRFV